MGKYFGSLICLKESKSSGELEKKIMEIVHLIIILLLALEWISTLCRPLKSKENW